MADPFLSLNEYVCDGIKTQFEISFAGGYLSRDHVVAIVADGKDANGNLINEVQVDFVWVSEYSVSISPAVAASKILRIYRNTPFNAPIVDFSDGSVITEATLDINAKQAVFLAAELRDRFGTVVDPALTAVYATEAKAARDDILNEVSGLVSTAGAGRVGLSNSAEYPANTVGSALNRFFNFSNPAFELISLGAAVPADGVYMGAKNSLSFQTLVSVPSGVPDIDNQRATLLVNATTNDDGNSEEQTVCIMTKIGTGFRPAWAQNTAYAVGANVEANNQIYRCTSAGTSAASGTGPSGVGTVINDGTVVWRWINAQAIGAKLGVYNETQVVPGAGSAWAMVNNLQLEAGYQGGFAATIENDLQNNSGVDSTTSSFYKFNTWLSVAGPNKSTAGIELTSSNLSNPAAIWGLHFSGDKLAEKAVIGVEASAEVGIGLGQASGGPVNPTFTVAAYRDTSVSPKAIALAGTNSSAAIEVTANTPVALNIGGTKSLAGIREGSTTPKGISLEGVYSSTAIEVTANTPVALNIGGAKSLAGIRDGSSSPRGLLLEGTYSKSPIRMASLPPSYADDAAAATGGLLVGDVYRTGSLLKVRVA